MSSIDEFIATIVFLGKESSDVHKRAVNAVNVTAKMQDSGMEESDIIDFLQGVLQEVTLIRRREIEVDEVWEDLRRIQMKPAVKFNESVDLKFYKLSEHEKHSKLAASRETNIRLNIYRTVGTDHFAETIADMAVKMADTPTKETLVW